MNKKQKRLTLRDLIHILGSKHQVFLLGSGMIQECLKNILAKQGVPLKCKETIEKAISDLDRIGKTSKEADALLNKIKDIVYRKLNPDKIKVDRKQILKLRKRINEYY